MDVSGFINTIGHKVIRDHTGVSKSAPGNWKKDGGIPPRYYPIFEKICKIVGVKCERRFFLFAEPAPPKPDPAEAPGP